MKEKALFMFYLLMPALLLFAGGESEGDSAPATTDAAEIVLGDEDLLSPEGLLEAITGRAESFFLVDTRTPEEYASGRIPTAVQIDYREIGDNPPTDEKDALIVVYCRSGNRSNSAAGTLRSLGYTRVLDWGGIIDWPYEVVTGTAPE